MCQRTALHRKASVLLINFAVTTPTQNRSLIHSSNLVTVWKWKCLDGTAPGYLSGLCVPVTSASRRQHLMSASTGLLQARTTIGRRSFAVAGPSLWNSLHAALRRPEMRRPICSTSDVLANRRNIHHRLALLWRFRDSDAGYKTADLLTYLMLTLLTTT